MFDTIFNHLIADFCFLARPSEPFFTPDLTSVRRATLGRWSGMLSLLGGGGSALVSHVFSYRLFV
jgi:hypothetical protein